MSRGDVAADRDLAVTFVRRVAGWRTLEEAVADVEWPGDPDVELEAEQEYKHPLPDDVADLIRDARQVLAYIEDADEDD